MKFASLGLFLTENCNLACSYCFAHNREPRNIEADLAERALETVLDWERFDPRLTLWGGEPFLRFPLLERIVETARRRAAEARREVFISVPTNATLLDRERLAFCRERRVQLSLSLDGAEEAQSLRRRVGGQSSFPEALRALDLVAETYPPESRPGIRMTVAPGTAAGLIGNIRFFLERGFDFVTFQPALETPWPEGALAALAEGLERAGGLIAEAIEAGSPRPPVLMPLARYLRALRHLDLGLAVPLRSCGAGYTMAAVDIDGGIHPCHRFVFYGRSRGGGEARLGRVGEGIDERRREAFREAHSAAPPAMARCAGCPAEGICEYRCVAVSYALSGDPAAVPESVCRTLALEAAAARKVHARLKGNPAYFRYLASLERRADDPTLRLIEVARRDMDALADRALRKLSKVRGEMIPPADPPPPAGSP